MPMKTCVMHMMIDREGQATTTADGHEVIPLGAAVIDSLFDHEHYHTYSLTDTHMYTSTAHNGPLTKTHATQ